MAQAIASTLSRSTLHRNAQTVSRSPCQSRPSPVLSVRAHLGGERFRERRDRLKRLASCTPRGGFYGAGRWGGPAGFKSGWAFTDGDLKNLAEEFEATMFGSKGRWSVGEDDGEGRMAVAADVVESPKAYVYSVDLPGVQRSDTKVQARREEQRLEISGKRVAPAVSENESVVHRRNRERRFGTFHRSFKLPEDADSGAITASFKDGVLTVTVPRVKPKEPQVVDIPVDADWTADSTVVQATAEENVQKGADDTPSSNS